jgi:ASC-1-like (ASCH) protein
MNLKYIYLKAIEEEKKTVEGRLNKGLFARLKVDDVIIFHCNDKQITVKITEINHYNTFREYLETEGLENCLPGVKTVSDGIEVYRQWYSEEDEKLYKVVAIRVALQASNVRFIKKDI